MESNPNLGDIDVTEYPENVTTDDATIVEVLKGTRAEIYDLEDDEEPKYGNRDDEFLRLEIEAVVDGEEFTVYHDMAYYDSPSNRSDLGKFVNRYGTPEPAMDVTVDFDEDGNSKVVL